MSVIDRSHSDHTQRLARGFAEKVRHIIAEHIYASPETVLEKIEVNPDILHDGLFPGHVRIIRSGFDIRNIVDRIVVELDVRRSHRV